MAKKAQSNSLNYKVRVYNETGIVKRRGEVVSQDANVTTIRYKKPRSSKYAIRPIPTSSVVFIESGSDKGTLIAYKGRELVGEYKGMVETDKSGLLKITTENNLVIMAAPHLVDAEADDESGAGEAAAKANGAKKKGAAAKAKGKKDA